jgi:parallel beta-helix repeat protein
MRRIEIDSLSLESHNNQSYPNYNKGFINGRVANLKSPMCRRPRNIPSELKKGKIYAILLIILLLIPTVFSVFIFQEEDLDLSDNDELDENPELIEVQDDTITFNAKEALKPRKSPQIRGTRGYSGTSPPVGDWTITGDAVVWNETITLDGNLTVTGTGNLTLINVTLKVNCNYNGQYHIEVLGGGGLYIYDYDWDRFTENDASNITAVDTNYTYLFWIQKDTYFEMRNSKVSWCGYRWSPSYLDSGLRIMTDFALIFGNEMSNCWYGIILYQNSDNIVENNTIKNNLDVGLLLVYSSNNEVINNVILNNAQYGLYIGASANNTITGCQIFSNTYSGICFIFASDNNVVNNTIYDNLNHGILVLSSTINLMSYNIIHNNTQYGIYIDSSSNNNVTMCNISNNRLSGIFLTSSSNNFILKNIVLNHPQYGIIIASSTNNNINNCTFLNNEFSGVYLSSSSSKNNIFNNLIYNNSIHGILLIGASYNFLIKNTIYNNSVQGIILDSSSHYNTILNCSIFNNSYYGIYIRSSSNNYVTHCNLQTNKRGVIYLTSSSRNNHIVNSSVVSTNGYDFQLASNSHLIALNTSFNRTNIRFDDSSSTLTEQWYLHVKLINFGDISIINGNIRIVDNINGTSDHNYTVGSEDFIKWIIVNESVQDSSKITYLTPHNITATIYLYNKAYIKYAFPEPLIDTCKTVTIDFNIYRNNTMRYKILYPGWNLISYPYVKSDYSIENVLLPIEGHYDAVQWYNISDTKDHWKHFQISKPSHLNDLNNLNHNIGFWVHINSSNEISFLMNGTLPKNDQMIQLYPGWNLVGYPSIVNRLRDDALNNLQFGNEIKEIYYFNSKSQSWKNLEVNEYIKWGVGYWFYLNSIATWIVNYTIPPVYNLDKDKYHDTIQEGIDSANDNDILKIASDVFYENITINKSIILVGNGKSLSTINGFINISSDNVFISSLGITNSTYGLILNDSNDVTLSNILFNNCTNNLFINNSNWINAEECEFLKCNVSISLFNSSNIFLSNSTIVQDVLQSFLLSNSTVAVINSSFNATKAQFLDDDSNIIVQWFLHVLIKDQLDIPIWNSSIHVQDNDNGTYNETFYSNYKGYVGYIIVTEYIANSSGNIILTPYNIETTHPDFSFYDVPFDVHINKSTTVVITSINTVNPTPIFNVNRNRHYLTIQEAIDDANPFDTIQISSGTYFENINIYKSLFLVGEDQYTTYINGSGEVCINITSDDVTISNLNIQNCTYGIYSDSNNGVKITETIISNNIYGFKCNDSSPIIEGCIFENNDYGIISFNSSTPGIINSTLQNNIFDLLMSDSDFITLNTHFNTTKVLFLDSTSTLTVKWYLHVRVHDAADNRIIGAKVWIRDNENGTFDMNFTTGSDGYVWYIVLTERIQNSSGNVSFNPFWINVSYYDPVLEWVNFTDNPRNISINGTIFEIRTEIFATPDIIPEFSQILIPIIAITASFVVFRRKRRTLE